MARSVRLDRVGLLLLVATLTASRAQGQSAAVRTAPDDPALAGNKFSRPWLVPASYQTPDPPPPQAELPRVPSVGPYGVSALSADPLLEPEPYQLGSHAAPGWYAAFDISLVKPHVANHVSSGTPLSPAFPTPIQLTVAPLNWTVSPRFELGYRLADGCGDLRLGYRFLATTGTERGADNTLRSRLDFNVFDFDYVSGEWLTENLHGPFRDLRLIMGIRLATSYLDSVASGGAILDTRFSSHFIGAGPHFGIEWSAPLPARGLEIYSRFDSAGLIGGTRQNFAVSALDGVTAIRRDPARGNGAMVVGIESGLAWRPGWARGSRLVLGYHFEQWWNLGRTDDSNFDLSVNGIFIRAEWRY